MSDLVTIEAIGPYLHIAPQGNLNASNVARLREEMAAAVGEQSPQVVLDLSAVEFIDSMALGAIANTAQLVRERRGGIVLCSMNSSVRKVFEITQMHRVFDIVPDLDAATSCLVNAPTEDAVAEAAHE